MAKILKIKHINFKKASLIFASSITALAPLAIVFACGESDAPSQAALKSAFDREVVNTSLNSIRVTTASTQDAVNWENVPVAIGQVKTYQFLSGNFPTKESVLSQPDTSWNNSLPSIVGDEHLKRHVWVRVNLGDNVESTDDVYFNITQSSGIQQIKTVLDNAGGYSAIDLSKIELQGNLTSAAFNHAPARLIPGVSVQFKSDAIDNGSWKSEAEFLNSVFASATFLDANNFSTISARIVNADPQKFTLNNAKTASAITMKFNFLTSVNQSTYITSLTNLLALNVNASSSDKLVWQTNNIVSEIGRYQLNGHIGTEFSINNKTSENDLANESFSATLPTETSVIYQPNRNLWIRTRKTSSTQDNPEYSYFNLSTSSGIRDVVGTIDAMPAYNSSWVNALGNIKLKGTPLDLSVDKTDPIVQEVLREQSLRIEYFYIYNGNDITLNASGDPVGARIFSGENAEANMLNYFKNNIGINSEITYTILSGFKKYVNGLYARLVSVDTKKYVFNDSSTPRYRKVDILESNMFSTNSFYSNDNFKEILKTFIRSFRLISDSEEVIKDVGFGPFITIQNAFFANSDRTKNHFDFSVLPPGVPGMYPLLFSLKNDVDIWMNRRNFANISDIPFESNNTTFLFRTPYSYDFYINPKDRKLIFFLSVNTDFGRPQYKIVDLTAEFNEAFPGMIPRR